jgi:hypothetical protein
MPSAKMGYISGGEDESFEEESEIKYTAPWKQ